MSEVITNKKSGKMPAGTKMVSIRMRDEEVGRVDAQAEKAGYTRADYIRMQVLNEDGSSIEVDVLTQLLEVLRQIEIMFDHYLSILNLQLDRLNENPGNEGIDVILKEITRSNDLMELCFKIQEEVVHILRNSGRR